jgi:hypothetical protein
VALTSKKAKKTIFLTLSTEDESLGTMTWMIPSSRVFALMVIGMTLQYSCIYSSEAFSISSPSFLPFHVQRTCPAFPIADFPSTRTVLALSAASSSNDDEDKSQQQNKKMDLPDYDNEEILLKINLALHPGVSIPDALQAVVTYSQSFPFAAVLPVQPLTYLPPTRTSLDDDVDGVEIKFLRKKTTEKSAVDGGIRFFVKETTSTPPTPRSTKDTTSSNDDIVDDDEEGDDNDEEEEECPVMDSSGKCLPAGTIEITAKRNSVGQTIRKITAERLIVTAFVAGITGMESEKYGPPPPIDQVYVTSVYHKWM